MELNFILGGRHYSLLSFSPGAGLYKRPDELVPVFASTAMEPMLGSITRFPRVGNTGGDIFYYDEETDNSVNSLGLPNAGWEEYNKVIPALVEQAKQAGKNLRVSFSGFSREDFLIPIRELIALLVKINGCAWVIIEINLSCPNTVDTSGKHHELIAYNPELVQAIMHGLYGEASGRLPLAFKFSPYDVAEKLDREVRQAICDGINADTAVYAGPIELVCGNTKGKQTMFRPDGRPALDVTNNMGGLAGKKLKPLNLENTAFFRTNLRTRHTIVGSGGVTCADDIFDYLVAGANKVQSTGFVAHYGLRALGPIFQNLADLAEAA